MSTTIRYSLLWDKMSAYATKVGRGAVWPVLRFFVVWKSKVIPDENRMEMRMRSNFGIVTGTMGAFLFVTLFFVCTSCSSKQSKAGDATEGESDTLITEDDSEALSEDSVPLARFFFSNDKELRNRDPLTYDLMDRIMQLSVAMPDSDADIIRFNWSWAKECSNEIDAYLKKKKGADANTPNGLDVNEACKNILSLIDDYNSGSQPEINTYSYISSTIAEYKAIKAYQDLQKQFAGQKEKDAVYKDYVAWAKFVDEMMSMYSERIQGEGGYSSASMEYGSALESLIECRQDELAQERDILMNKKTFTDSNFNWVTDENFKIQQLWYLNYSAGEDAQLENTKDPDKVHIALRNWLKQRESNAKLIANSSSRQSYFDYAMKIRYDVVRMLMNKVSYLESPDQVSYGVIMARSKSRLKGFDYNNYIFYNGEYIYFDGCVKNTDQLSYFKKGAKVAKMKNGRILTVFINVNGEEE